MLQACSVLSTPVYEELGSFVLADLFLRILDILCLSLL